jgi:glycosyltransferase involved in cell wall biosynthesis
VKRAGNGHCKEMHVVHVYKDVYPPVVGGIERHIDLIRRAMPDVHSDVLVCARAIRGNRAAVGTGTEIRVGELGPRVWSVPVSPAFLVRLRQTRADVVHLHMPNPLGELAVLLDRKRPVVCSYHADIVRQARVAPLYAPLVRACLARASEIVVGSKRLQANSPFIRADADRATVVPYFVDIDRLSRSRVPERVRGELRARYPGRIVLSVARLVYYKGLDVLIESARSVDAQFVIIGDGPLAKQLRQFAKTSPNVHLAGHVSDETLLAYFAVADCFVLPSTSRAESFGISVLEAQAMGVPAVVTDVGTGTVEAIVPGKTGLVVPPGDADRLARAINEILDETQLRESMARDAREWACNGHSMENAAVKLRAIYERARAGDQLT